MIEYLSRSAEETKNIGKAFGERLPPNSIVCFYGDLGAGKTTFIKGLAAGVLGTSGEEISSPTFTYLNIHHGKKTLYHFDLYRLRDADEFLGMGFDETFDAGGVCCIEWAERIMSLDMQPVYKIEMAHLGGDERAISIRGEGDGKIQL